MKSKHIHLLFNSFAFAIAFIVCVYLYEKQETQLRDNFNAVVNSTAPSISVDFDRLIKVKNSIQSIENASLSKQNIDLRVLGYSNASNIDYEIFKNDDVLVDYRVSMAIVFNQSKYCVINNKFYQEGDKLNENTYVKHIESNRVLISVLENEKWYEVTNLNNKGNLQNERSIVSNP